MTSQRVERTWIRTGGSGANGLTNRYFSTTQVMVLRNHGIVICAETIEQALLSANDAVKACKYQVRYNSFI